MNSLMVLDCTLRDGGYINDWMFGQENIHKTIFKLTEAKINIIECGFLTKKKDTSPNSSQFNSVEQIESILPSEKDNSIYVAMINFGEFDIDELSSRKEGGLDGIRVAFHKKDREEALEFCQVIKEKGYMVFLQPMVSLSYSDKEFLDIIHKTNQIKPFAFYIVDSFGAMKRDDLLHLFYLTDYNLSDEICIGFHSHNNSQLSYSHAQTLSNHLTNRDLIIDSSVMGMGRGAGNLNTELFAEYLNHFHGANYKVSSLLQIMDDVIAPIFENTHWGYSLPQYLSAMHNCHPNYASYLDNKNTLTFENINELFAIMDIEKKAVFDIEYIKNLYTQYQGTKSTDNIALKELKEQLKGKEVLILAPGKSLKEEKEVVEKAIEKSTVVIAVNFIPKDFKTDFVFVSNLRRWEAMQDEEKHNIIVTSNIRELEGIDYVVNYTDLINNVDAVKDNAAMMLISLLISLEVKLIKLAGLDGYSYKTDDNFVQHNMEFMKDTSIMEAMNLGMSDVLSKYAKIIDISFITNPRHVRLYISSNENV